MPEPPGMRARIDRESITAEEIARLTDRELRLVAQRPARQGEPVTPRVREEEDTWGTTTASRRGSEPRRGPLAGYGCCWRFRCLQRPASPSPASVVPKRRSVVGSGIAPAFAPSGSTSSLGRTNGYGVNEYASAG